MPMNGYRLDLVVKFLEVHKNIKENENFRRFNYRSSDKVYKEFILYAIGINIHKYHRFLYEKLKKFEGKTA